MVKWQKFVSLTFEVARQKGESFDGLNEAQDAISVASEIKDEHGDISTLNVAEARALIDDNIEVI